MHVVVAAAGRKAASWTSLTWLEGITQTKQAQPACRFRF
jgi:hypothetical protein